MPSCYGCPSKHINKSNGADTDVMKFYCTTNATTYGRKWSKFQPRPGRHTGTGYLSNFRPGVYYQSHLDEIDNPAMGHVLRDNYHTVTQKSFKPYHGPDGTEALPNSCKQVGSGFVREKPLSIPTEFEVKNVHIDTRAVSAPAGIMPHERPRLHTIRANDPVENENGGYGPGYMTTETHERFMGRQPDRLNPACKSVGGKEGSGFTHAYNVEPLTFHPDYAHRNEMPAWLTDRPTGVSIMKTHYRPSEFSKGDEPLPRIANRSVRETGFTSGTQAHPPYLQNHPAEADPSGTGPGTTSGAFQAKPTPPSEAARLGRATVGKKELTGFSENGDRYIYTNDDPMRFITHYNTKYLDRTAKGSDREGHTWGGVLRVKPDGFTRSTKRHHYGSEYDASATLRNLDPYVARSIKARDVFYDDHVYDTKLHRSHTTMLST